jgi:zinc protease
MLISRLRRIHMINSLFRSALAGAAALFAVACGTQTEPAKEASVTPVETFTLENGLRVVLNVDKSDPVVAVEIGRASCRERVS